MADKTSKAADAPQTVRIQWAAPMPAWVKQTYTDDETKLTWDARDGAVQEVPAEHAERILAIKSPNIGAFKEAS